MILCNNLKLREQLNPEHIKKIFITPETWLNSDVYNNEIFPQDYQIFWVDREDGYGGVFFACHNTMNCTQIPLHSQCEAVACRINLSGSQTLIVLAVYRPPNRDIQCM